MVSPTRLPVPHDSLYRQVADALRAEIAQGHAKPGDRLVEMSLARQFAVSQGPVREALRLLEREGLVTHRPRRGVYVTELSAQAIDEIYSLRSAVEGLAARRFLRYHQASDYTELDGCIHDMKEAAWANDATSVVAAALKFHEAICRLSRHERLLSFWQDMVAQTQYYAQMAGHFQADLWDDVRQHQEVLEALRTGDPDIAEQASKRHTHDAGRTLLRAALHRGLLIAGDQSDEARESSRDDWALILEPCSPTYAET